MRSSFGKVFMGAAGSGGASGDQFNRVSFMSHFEGANNGVNNAFDDGSASNHTITANGNVTQGSFGPFARPDGEWGWNFDGTDDFLTVPDSTDFNIASDAAFTLELWAFYPSFATQSHFVDTRPASTQGLYFTCSIGGGGTDNGKVKFYTNSDFRIITASTVPLNSWVHIALVRSSGTTKIYINGTADNNTYSDTNAYISGDWIIGKRSNSSGSQMGGLFSNYRFVNGTAVYTSNFTPSTSKLTAITNTKLLTCQSNRFVDNSASGHTVTPSGGAAISAFGPFLTSSVYDPAVNGASLNTPGAGGDYLSFGNIGLDGHSGDFSIEAWIYPTSYSQYSNTIYAQGGTGNTANLLELSLNSSGQPHAFIHTGSVTLQSTFVCPINAWTFLQLKRTSGTLAIFTNGVQSSTVSNTTTIGSPNSGFVGAQSYDPSVSTRSFRGFICDVRCSVVTRSVSLPTAPLAVTDSNTKLLLNMADGQAIDSAAQNNLTLYGNAKISTGQAKFGNTSMVFDGTGDYVMFDTLNGPLEGLSTTSPATIEGYFNWDGTQESGGFRTVIGINRLSDGNNTLVLYCGNSSGQGILGLRYSGGSEQVLDSSIATNTWHHFAMVLNSSSYKFQFFLNGTSVFTSTSTINVAPSDCSFVIGAEADGANAGSLGDTFTGYIDEIRVSQMARYTSNFTAPTEPFADKGQ